MHKWLAIMSAVVSFTLVGCTGVPNGVEPVSDFEVERYLGQWYEIARYDHSFEEGLTNVTARYSLRDDGGISVVNKGFNPEQEKWDEALGKAYFVSSPDIGHLKVSFFGPFYASYVVMALDKEAYGYALVTGPDRDYLWILAREKTLPEETLAMLVTRAEALGYEKDKLIWVEHSGGQ